jgi:hypothetical protein
MSGCRDSLELAVPMVDATPSSPPATCGGVENGSRQPRAREWSSPAAPPHTSARHDLCKPAGGNCRGPLRDGLCYAVGGPPLLQHIVPVSPLCRARFCRCRLASLLGTVLAYSTHGFQRRPPTCLTCCLPCRPIAADPAISSLLDYDVVIPAHSL